MARSANRGVPLWQRSRSDDSGPQCGYGVIHGKEASRNFARGLTHVDRRAALRYPAGSEGFSLPRSCGSS